MENYYSILECGPDATIKEIKESYQRLCLINHPDKNQSTKTDSLSTTTVRFILINKAYKVLSDSNLRQEYDARWQQRALAQEWPIQDEVDFDEFEEEIECGDRVTYAYPCRCGAEYSLSETDVQFRVDYVQCSHCSLCVKVKYEGGGV